MEYSNWVSFQPGRSKDYDGVYSDLHKEADLPGAPMTLVSGVSTASGSSNIIRRKTATPGNSESAPAL